MTANRKARDFFEAVCRMRESQKEYARRRCPSAGAAAQRFERAVDAIIEEINEELANERQPELFQGGQT